MKVDKHGECGKLDLNQDGALPAAGYTKSTCNGRAQKLVRRSLHYTK